jgi:hypothetical protein
LNNFFVLGGDLNAKHKAWLNQYNEERRIKLNNWLIQNNFNFKCQTHLTDAPTYPRTNSYLDLFLTDIILGTIDVDQLNRIKTIPYDSDHKSIYIPIELPNKFELKSSTNKTYANYRVNWDNFLAEYRDAVKIPNNRNLTISEVDHHFKKNGKNNSNHYGRIYTGNGKQKYLRYDHVQKN